MQNVDQDGASTIYEDSKKKSLLLLLNKNGFKEWKVLCSLSSKRHIPCAYMLQLEKIRWLKLDGYCAGKKAQKRWFLHDFVREIRTLWTHFWPLKSTVRVVKWYRFLMNSRWRPNAKRIIHGCLHIYYSDCCDWSKNNYSQTQAFEYKFLWLTCMMQQREYHSPFLGNRDSSEGFDSHIDSKLTTSLK